MPTLRGSVGVGHAREWLQIRCNSAAITSRNFFSGKLAKVESCVYSDFLLHLPGGVIPMQITSKGQVTIPQEVRNRLGLLPHTEVEFEVAGDHARIRKARRTGGSGVRGKNALRALRGSANTRMSTDEIMSLTRGGGRPGGHGK